MPEPLVCLYRELAHAEAARQALLCAGFAADAVALSSQGDEAGGMKGNFVIGDGNHHPQARNRDADDYANNFRDVDFGGVFLLSVQLEPHAAADTALEIMRRFHGEPPDASAGDPGTAPRLNPLTRG